MLRWLVVMVLTLLPPMVAVADEVEAPLVDRPVHVPFSEAVARFAADPATGGFVAPFAIATDAQPRELEPLAPTTLTVTVRARGPVLRPPVRPDLRQLPAFAAAFHIEDLTDGRNERNGAATFRWVYRLRPRTEAVSEVPGVPLLFYNPDIRPPAKSYQTLCSDPIALTVRQPERPIDVAALPPLALEWASGPDALTGQTPWTPPDGRALAAVLLAPPLLSLAVYLLWRHWYPDAVRAAHRRRSRAARVVLRHLQRARRLRGRASAEAVMAALTAYLRDRFDLRRAEPTPSVVEALLPARGCPPELASEAAALLAQTAAARFQPEESSAAPPVEVIRRFILAVEERACCPSS